MRRFLHARCSAVGWGRRVAVGGGAARGRQIKGPGGVPFRGGGDAAGSEHYIAAAWAGVTPAQPEAPATSWLRPASASTVTGSERTAASPTIGNHGPPATEYSPA